MLNNPCPTNYRLPTDAEMDEERISWNSNNSIGAFNSSLKLTMAGRRNHSSGGALSFVGYFGYYWSNTVSSTSSKFLMFSSNPASVGSNFRAYGYSVRCIKN